MAPVTYLGMAAALFTTGAFVPQVVRAWRTRSTRDLSASSFLAYATGLAMWLLYGIFIHDAPLIASNGTTFVLALIILTLKLRHG
jgi:MtN3 and saliva related transmembrane protein